MTHRIDHRIAGVPERADIDTAFVCRGCTTSVLVGDAPEDISVACSLCGGTMTAMPYDAAQNAFVSSHGGFHVDSISSPQPGYIRIEGSGFSRVGVVNILAQGDVVTQFLDSRLRDVGYQTFSDTVIEGPLRLTGTGPMGGLDRKDYSSVQIWNDRSTELLFEGPIMPEIPAPHDGLVLPSKPGEITSIVQTGSSPDTFQVTTASGNANTPLVIVAGSFAGTVLKVHNSAFWTEADTFNEQGNSSGVGVTNVTWTDTTVDFEATEDISGSVVYWTQLQDEHGVNLVQLNESPHLTIT